MDESLVNRVEAARLLGLEPRSFDLRRPSLIASFGLKEIKVGDAKRYLRSSINFINEMFANIEQAAEQFGQSRRSFERFKSKYIRHGLEELAIGRTKYYTRQSISKMIKHAHERDLNIGV